MKIQRGIFKKDSPSPLLFVILMMLLNYILTKCTKGCKNLQNYKKRLITLCTWVALNCLQKNEKDMKTQNTIDKNIQTGYRDRICHRICSLLITNCRKRQVTEGIKLPNQERIKTLGEEENYTNLRILELNSIKEAEMKEKIRKK